MTHASTGRSTIALAAVSLSALMFGLEISSIPAILPTLEQVLHADFKQLQWIMNAYTIACTTVLMATGTLADRYGRKLIFMIGIVAFGITSLICGLAQDAAVLIAGRFLQGMSGGAMLICQVAILSHQFPAGRQRGTAFGWWGIIFGIGLGFGPIIGGAIVAVSNWQWVFLVHGVLALVTLALAMAGVGESKDPKAERLDVAGIATLSVAVFCLAYFITQGPDLGFASPSALAIIGLAAASLVAFVVAETLNPRPMFDFSVFRIRSFSGALIGSVGMNFSFWPFMIYLPIYFQAGLGYDSVAAGLALLAYTLPTLVVPPLGERLALRYRPGLTIPAGLFTIGLGFILMWFGSAADQASWLTMLPGCLLSGVGLGLTNTPVTNTTTASVPGERAGMASGIDMSARMISLAVNIALMGFILVEGVLSHLRGALPSLDAAQLRPLAERIAAGSVTAATQAAPDPSSLGTSATIVHQALVHGFGWVLLFGGIGIWLLAALSFIAFGPAAPAGAPTPSQRASS
ncbi:MFS transporter [Phreatobacter stygius]|uniref:MFS transporter n=1 Tax=Phreatobacter stygius TaxID=1940610 RepID=A0A4D7B486_9HYPH|nr:MFS transporter [Phreatobacter stygius]QCI62827.1 MFS transporter [Phreatobacter stygius]